MVTPRQRLFASGLAVTLALVSGHVPAVAESSDDRPSRPDLEIGSDASVESQAVVMPSVFSDTRGSVHEESIDAAATAQIVAGFSDGTFRPGTHVSRAQIAAFLARAVALPASSAVGFSDVDESAHRGSIAALAGAGIVTGFSDGTFRPDESVSRGQMAVLVAKALRLDLTAPLKFTDVGAVHADYVAAVTEAGIVAGVTDTTFEPDRPVTRGQLATVISNALKLTDHPGSAARWLYAEHGGTVSLGQASMWVPPHVMAADGIARVAPVDAPAPTGAASSTMEAYDFDIEPPWNGDVTITLPATHEVLEAETPARHVLHYVDGDWVFEDVDSHDVDAGTVTFTTDELSEFTNHLMALAACGVGLEAAPAISAVVIRGAVVAGGVIAALACVGFAGAEYLLGDVLEKELREADFWPDLCYIVTAGLFDQEEACKKFQERYEPEGVDLSPCEQAPTAPCDDPPRAGGSVPEGTTLSFQVDPSSCAIGECSESSPMSGVMSGFTPNASVAITVRLPDGSDGNAVSGYGYTTKAFTDGSGTFKWVWWPDPGDALGTYSTTIVDNATGRTASADFAISKASTDDGGSTTPVTKNVSISKGSKPTSEPDCTTSSCRYINASGSGFAANSSVTIQCQENTGSGWSAFWTTKKSTNSAGSISYSSCFYGFPDNKVRVLIDGVVSNTITW